MAPEIRDKILRILDAHRIMTLATLRPDGWPQATTVGYVSEGLDIYFMCGRDSQKARNLARDDRVSATIDHDTPDPMAIVGLSLAARAVAVTDPVAIRRTLLDLLPRKYPEYQAMMGGLNLDEVAVYRLAPVVFSVLDYSKGFGHADLAPAADVEAG